MYFAVFCPMLNVRSVESVRKFIYRSIFTYVLLSLLRKILHTNCSYLYLCISVYSEIPFANIPSLYLFIKSLYSLLEFFGCLLFLIVFYTSADGRHFYININTYRELFKNQSMLDWINFYRFFSQPVFRDRRIKMPSKVKPL